MRPCQAASLLWVLLALSGCARSAPVQRATPVRDETLVVEGFHFPRRADIFRLEEAFPLESREAGWQVRYGSFEIPSLRADLFVYPIVVPELLSLAKVLDEQQRAMVAEIEAMALQNDMASVITQQHSLTVPGSAPRIDGIHTVFQMQQADTPLVSHAFLTALGRHYVKVRFSYPREVEAVATRAFERFLGAALAAAAWSGDAAPALSLLIVKPQPDTSVCTSVVWGLGYGTVMLEWVDKGTYLDSFDRELAARSKALEIWNLIKQGKLENATQAGDCDADSLDAMIEAQERGLFEEYVWRYFAKPYWHEPMALDREAFARFEKSRLVNHDPVFETGAVVRYAPVP